MRTVAAGSRDSRIFIPAVGLAVAKVLEKGHYVDLAADMDATLGMGQSLKHVDKKLLEFHEVDSELRKLFFLMRSDFAFLTLFFGPSVNQVVGC